MILNIHSDASYLSEPSARSRTYGHFFMGSTPKNGEPIFINGKRCILCQHNNNAIRCCVAAEAELGALFRNCQDGIIFRLTLSNLRHPQPKTPVHCDNATAVGIASNTVKRQRSRAMEMRFFWTGDKVSQKMYDIFWNLADYQSKHHVGSHHVNVRPWYLHMDNSLRFLPRALKPSTLKGCVGTLEDGYICKVPLPSVYLLFFLRTFLGRMSFWKDILFLRVPTLTPVQNRWSHSLFRHKSACAQYKALFVARCTVLIHLPTS